MLLWIKTAFIFSHWKRSNFKASCAISMAPQKVTGVATNVGAVNVDTHNRILEFEHSLVKVWGSVRASYWGHTVWPRRGLSYRMIWDFLAKKLLQNLKPSAHQRTKFHTIASRVGGFGVFCCISCWGVCVTSHICAHVGCVSKLTKALQFQKRN